MAKSRKMTSGYIDPLENDLFAHLKNRSRRRLFLPNQLLSFANDKRLDTTRREEAFKMMRKWWDLADNLKLNRNETSIDDLFLSEIFGQALGYTSVTENEEKYYRERQFHVPGIGAADGALGIYPPKSPENTKVIIELKSADNNIDKDRSNGRTAVQQAWDYLNAMPEACQWAIVSNFTTIRLYHRNKGSQVYEEFKLRELATNRQYFNQFYAIFEVEGLVKHVLKSPPRTTELLEKTETQQRVVGDQLYQSYSENRLKLINHLHKDKAMSIAQAIAVAQKLIDRIIFIAFCEDRKLIKAEAIKSAYQSRPMISKIKNPAWQNFLGLFDAMDKGHEAIDLQNGYNGGLFAEDEIIDNLDLDDDPWANFFMNIASYDFEHEVNVDVLGHLFEKSITELERLREGAFLSAESENLNAPMMPKSPAKKLFGVYYTPSDFTSAICNFTIDELVTERFQSIATKLNLSEKQITASKKNKALKQYWQLCYEMLLNFKICDPACGSGAFLIQAYDTIYDHYAHVITELEHQNDKNTDQYFDNLPETILKNNIYGVDLQPEAVEIAQLALWLRTARNGKTLANLSQNIIAGNSLVDDPEIHHAAMNFKEVFPDVFNRDNPGFDCIIGNPPWERIKLQEREFFALSAPDIAAAPNAAQRRKKVKKLETKNPELHQEYLHALEQAEKTLNYARKSKRYPLTGKGDINTYVLFAELATQIVAPDGRIGLLVPSGISTDKTTAQFFNAVMEKQSLIRLYDFENKKGVFADVHRAFKFSILNLSGSSHKQSESDFIFFAHSLKDLGDKNRHIALTADDMKRMNPNTKTCPVFRSREDAEITKQIYSQIPVLIDKNRKHDGNPWGIKFHTMFHQTNDAEHFLEAQTLKEKRCRLEGNRWLKGKKTYLPLYEAKMIQAYNHRAAGVEVVEGNWMRQGQTVKPSLVDYQNPEFSVMPRYWVDENIVSKQTDYDIDKGFIAYKDVTSPTNQRTMIASMLPLCGMLNSAPIVFTAQDRLRELCLLANLNSHVYDFVARQKVGNVHLNFFIVEQLPTLTPDIYDDPCPWDKSKTLQQWITPRVLKLSCTSDDMIPLAHACDFEPEVTKWKPRQRQQWLAELDAAYFILYNITREQVIYILTTFQQTRRKHPDGELFDKTDPNEALSGTGLYILETFDQLAAQ